MAKHDASPETAAAVTSLTTDQFAQLLAAVKGGGSSENSAIALLADTMERLVAAQNRSADATEKTIIRQNAVHPGLSAFSHAEGEVAHPKNKLANHTLFLGVPQFEDSLTPVEIDLFNSITSGRNARDGAWQAVYTPSTNGGKSTLNITIAITEGDLASTPPLVQILAELATGAKAEDVSTLLVDMAQMKAELDALKALQPVGA